MITLLIVSEPDIASKIQGDAILARGGWNESDVVEGGKSWSHNNSSVYLWNYPGRVLMEDDLDKRFSMATGKNVTEVIFLSRHYAASGQPSLTLHVIGVPGEIPTGEKAEFGGIKGKVVPPNTRFAAWFRKLNEVAYEHNLVPEFDLTIETTHHGPILSVPTMFVEIGSSESHWGRVDAAEAWADVIIEGLGLDGGSGFGKWDSLTDEEQLSSKVMIGIGGGHYAPRHSDVIRKTDCWAGHQIASYSLEMEKPKDENWDGTTEPYPDGQWAHSIKVCLESTKISFPNGILIAHLDRKSFKGWQRQAIKRLCEEIGLPIGRTRDFE
tara:strand:- start:1932 stop:2906 length:975 start_codon:yes stop_codon:yes gene_type:complete